MEIEICEAGKRLWQRFPPGMREQIKPFLLSTYVLQCAARPCARAAVAHFSVQTNYRQWLKQWCASYAAGRALPALGRTALSTLHAGSARLGTKVEYSRTILHDRAKAGGG